MQQGIDYYINEEGLLVFTAKAHLDRGYCCGRGCKHCPYDYMNVPEIKRQRLLEARKNDEEGNKS